jgi:hypothetical protein
VLAKVGEQKLPDQEAASDLMFKQLRLQEDKISIHSKEDLCQIKKVVQIKKSNLNLREENPMPVNYNFSLIYVIRELAWIRQLYEYDEWE